MSDLADLLIQLFYTAPLPVTPGMQWGAKPSLFHTEQCPLRCENRPPASSPQPTPLPVPHRWGSQPQDFWCYVPSALLMFLTCTAHSGDTLMYWMKIILTLFSRILRLAPNTPAHTISRGWAILDEETELFDRHGSTLAATHSHRKMNLRFKKYVQQHTSFSFPINQRSCVSLAGQTTVPRCFEGGVAPASRHSLIPRLESTGGRGVFCIDICHELPSIEVLGARRSWMPPKVPAEGMDSRFLSIPWGPTLWPPTSVQSLHPGRSSFSQRHLSDLLLFFFPHIPLLQGTGLRELDREQLASESGSTVHVAWRTRGSEGKYFPYPLRGSNHWHLVLTLWKLFCALKSRL